MGSKATVRLLNLGYADTGYSSLRSASFKSPFTWLRETLDLKYRQQHTEKEIEEARKQQLEKGQGSVFESLPELADEAEGEKAQLLISSPKAKGKKATDVCCE